MLDHGVPAVGQHSQLRCVHYASDSLLHWRLGHVWKVSSLGYGLPASSWPVAAGVVAGGVHGHI